MTTAPHALWPADRRELLACVRQLSEFYDRSPDQVSPRSRFASTCLTPQGRQESRPPDQHLGDLCIKLFWEKTLRRPWPQSWNWSVPRAIQTAVVLSASEVRRVLAAVEALDHRVCLTTLYSCGLR